MHKYKYEYAGITSYAIDFQFSDVKCVITIMNTRWMVNARLPHITGKNILSNLHLFHFSHLKIQQEKDEEYYVVC